MQLYLIRHPRPLVAPGVCYGQLDLPLAEPADAAATLLRAALQEARATAHPAAHPAGAPAAQVTVISSPLRRCRELAMALDPVPRFDSRLMELDFGAWEGTPWDAIPRADLDRWAADPFGFAPPGGEAPAAMAARVVAFAAEIEALAAGGDLLVVAHHGPLRVLAAHLLGLPPTASLRLQFDFARLACFTLAPAGNVLRWLNR